MLDPSVSSILRSKYTIRSFYLLFSLLLFVCVLTSYIFSLYTGNYLATFLSSLLSQIASTFASIMAIYLVWIIVTPSNLRNSNITALRPDEIPEFLGYVAEDPADYIFFGRSGKSFRNSILPKIDSNSKERRSAKSIRVIVPDPSSGSNSISYAKMMKGLSEEAKVDTLAISVVAMALDLAARSTQNTDLRIEMRLCSNLPILRMDLSEKGGVLTRDAKILPAIYCGPGGYLDLFRTMAENEYRQSKQITWSEEVNYNPKMSADEINSAFSGLPIVTNEMLPEIMEIFQQPSSRYEK